MSMSFADVLSAVHEAEATQSKADAVVRDLAHMTVGRLRSAGVSAYYLKKLKRELRDFNILTGNWKD